MSYEEYMEDLRQKREYDCSCHINPPCTFCTDTVGEMYEEWCEENGTEPEY